MVTGRKLLLADDSVTIQKVVNLTFADEGMRVTVVSNGLEAIEKLEGVAPDIVLADVHMPGLNGYQVCERIKRNEHFRHIPVMLLVGSFEPFDEAEARRVGADDVLTKPFQSIRQLVSKVGTLLSGGGSAEKEATPGDLHPKATKSGAAGAVADGLERATADTAPLPPQTPGGTGKRAAREDSFADLLLDDEMIEAALAKDLRSAGNASGVSQTRSPAKLDVSVREGAGDQATTGSVKAQETPKSFSMRENNLYESSQQSAAPPSSAAPPPAGPATNDDDLLGLGDFEPPAAIAEADDFILDLRDEPASQRSAATLAPPSVGTGGAGFNRHEAAKDASPRPGEEIAETLQMTGDMQRAERPAPTEAAAQAAAVRIGGTARVDDSIADRLTQRTGQITLDQLSPEAIDAIARRAVEHLSAKVVEEIAWEVVPQLAELLIKRHLEEEKSRTQ